MFSIARSETYSWPVEVEYPVKPGVKKKESFEVEFRRLSQSKIKELLAQINEGKIEDDLVVARELVVGWKGVVDESKEEVPFSEAALGSILDIPGVGSAIVASFFESLRDGKRKN